MNKLKLLSIALALSIGFAATAETGLTLNTSTKVDMDVSVTSDNVYTIVTTGSDPHISSTALSAALGSAEAKLQFQYQVSEDIDDVQLFFCDPETEARSMHVYGLLKKTSVWTTATVNIAAQKESFGWGGAGSRLRLDFGNKSGVTIKIRYLGINGQYTVSTAQRNAEAEAVAKYLGATYPSEVSNVDVTADKIVISGRTSASGCKLIDIRATGSASHLSGYSDVADLPQGDFTVETARFINVEGYTYDRLLSKWAIVDAGHGLLSHAHYADNVAPIRHAEPGVLKSKKGLGGIFNVNLGDIQKLGLHSVTLNVFFKDFMRMTRSSDNQIPYEYMGRTYYIDPESQAYYDNVIRTCENNGVVVAAILLVSPTGGDVTYTSTMCHPEYSGTAPYSMPDVTDIEGIHAYAATIDYLANRYSVSGQGRIHHWIMHNEVDQNRYWTDMGLDQPLLRYMEHYQRSMRLVYNIVRQYDPNAYVLGSFTSCWTLTNGNGGFSSKSMIDLLVTFGNVEGDYRWGIAYHPYPQNFYKPRFWVEDTDATYSEDAGFCTFKNMEVISDWILRREHYYKGQEKRILFFSENGVNSMDNSSTYLNIQAAGAAWAWKKVVKNSGVDAVMWHNWFDNASEGLCLGLRDKDLNPKPVWYVWQAAGTENESAVLDQYKSVIGISDWNQIHAGVALSGVESARFNPDLTTCSGINGSYDANTQSYTLTTTNGDPQVNTSGCSSKLSTNSNILVFEYKSDKYIGDFQIFFSPLAEESRSIMLPLAATSEWKRVYVDITHIRALYGWGGAGSFLRIDPCRAAGFNFQIRHIVVNSGEIADMANLDVVSSNANNCSLSFDNQAGNCTATTTGSDPYFHTSSLPANLSEKANKLIFEYQSSAAVTTQVYFLDYPSELRSVRISLPAAASWTRREVDIENIRKEHGWGFEGDLLRFDPADNSGVTFKIRNICVNSGESTSSHDLILDSYASNDLSLSRDTNPWESGSLDAFGLTYDSWVVNTTGTDPHMVTNPLEKNLNADATKLYFEYQSSADINPVEIFVLNPETAQRAQKFYNVMPATSEWRSVELDLSALRNTYGWGYAGNRLRIDLGGDSGVEVKICRVAVYNGENSLLGTGLEADGDYVIYGTIGGAVVKTNEKQCFTFYNLMGIAVSRVEVDGEEFVSLVPGVYIVNGQKIMVR